MIKYKQAKPVFKTSVQAKVKESEKFSFDWLGTALKLSALLLLGMYLYGYGAAVGYASYFGIPQSALYSSSTDLLGIASETLYHFTLNFFSTGGIVAYFWSMVNSDFNIQYIYYGLAFSAAWFAIIYLAKIKQTTALMFNKFKNFFFPEIKIHLSESKLATIFRSLGYGFLSSIVFFIAKTVASVSVLIFYLLILIAPVWGYFAAINHAEVDIIRPAQCDPVQTRVQLIDALEKQKVEKSKGIKAAPVEHSSNCVKVTFTDDKGSKTIAGRSVLAGSDYILIYEMNGKTTRIPLKTAVIETANDAVLKEVELQNEKLLAKKAQ